jgi:hypothetical protein
MVGKVGCGARRRGVSLHARRLDVGHAAVPFLLDEPLAIVAACECEAHRAHSAETEVDLLP